jgi:hypothetical protein
VLLLLIPLEPLLPEVALPWLLPLLEAVLLAEDPVLLEVVLPEPCPLLEPVALPVEPAEPVASVTRGSPHATSDAVASNRAPDRHTRIDDLAEASGYRRAS